MDIARLNMSHGAHEDHAEQYRVVREAADASGKAVGILADLQGPKIRLERFKPTPDGSKWQLRRGQAWTITTRDIDGDDTISGTTYKGLPGDVKVGDMLLVDDGRLRLRVTGVTDGTDVHVEVLVGGPVSDHKGINLPGVAVSVPALSEKDIDDLRFALALGVDYIALSFVRNAADAEDVRAIMREEGRMVPVIAKIEKPQAIDNLDEVIDAFDAFMVARGDLGVECPLEEVPFLQKKIINKARLNAKPVIVATQMLDSMISSPAPTRAEANDVANAVLDGADAVMLSAETSVGDYPVHTVETMARIISATEAHAFDSGNIGHLASIEWDPHTRGGVIAKPPRRSPSGSARSTWSRSPPPGTPPSGSPASADRSRSSPSPRTSSCAPSWLWPGGSSRSASTRSSTPTTWSARSTRRCCRSGAWRRATWW